MHAGCLRRRNKRRGKGRTNRDRERHSDVGSERHFLQGVWKDTGLRAQRAGPCGLNKGTCIYAMGNGHSWKLPKEERGIITPGLWQDCSAASTNGNQMEGGEPATPGGQATAPRGARVKGS